jgi:hypothetical protein
VLGSLDLSLELVPFLGEGRHTGLVLGLDLAELLLGVRQAHSLV